MNQIRTAKVTDKERNEYKSILLEVCAKYGIEPFPELFDNLDERIIANRKNLQEARRNGRKVGKALRQHIDNSIVSLLNG